MKNKSVFVFGMISLVIFIGIAAYLWYLYFHNYEGRLIAENESFAFMRGVEFVNSGPIDYVNANAKVVNAISNINAIVNQLRIDLGKIVSTPDGINEPSLFDEIHYILKDKEIKDS